MSTDIDHSADAGVTAEPLARDAQRLMRYRVPREGAEIARNAHIPDTASRAMSRRFRGAVRPGGVVDLMEMTLCLP